MKAGMTPRSNAAAATAGLVAGLPSKDGIKEAVVGGSQATVELLLEQHKRLEQERWEVSRGGTASMRRASLNHLS